MSLAAALDDPYRLDFGWLPETLPVFGRAALLTVQILV